MTRQVKLSTLPGAPGETGRWGLAYLAYEAAGGDPVRALLLALDFIAKYGPLTVSTAEREAA